MAILLDTVVGQATAIETLRRALGNDRVHHAYLFDGPEGVGRELAAFGFAQALVCERRSAPPAGPSLFGGAEATAEPANKSSACGECSACTRAMPRADAQGRPIHPDIVVLERGLYEPGLIGRKTPESQDISIDQVRTLVLARAAFGPHEGRAKVFIVRRAEELSTSAANALLKTLEEPLDRTHFILLSAHPDVLLPTIRSRTLRIRFAPLGESLVTKLLTERGVEAGMAAALAHRANGSIGQALALADATAAEAATSFTQRALAAVASKDFTLALDLAGDAKKAKAELEMHLAAFSAALAAEGRTRALAGDPTATAYAHRHELALRALRELDGNAAPALVVESMLSAMRAAR